MKALKGLAVFAAAAMVTTVAHAATFDVTVWTGAPNGIDSKTFADNNTPTGLASAHFTWDTDINWVVGPPQNTDPSGNLVSDFLGDSSHVSGFSSPRGTYADLSAFLSASLSQAGDAYASYFKIVGFGGGKGTITHDDGASIYDFQGNAVYSSPGETSAVTSNFVLPVAHTFTVYYVEGNGSPSVLNITGGNSVPEPASWALMLLGFGGLGAAFRARRRIDAVA